MSDASNSPANVGNILDDMLNILGGDGEREPGKEPDSSQGGSESVSSPAPTKKRGRPPGSGNKKSGKDPAKALQEQVFRAFIDSPGFEGLSRNIYPIPLRLYSNFRGIPPEVPEVILTPERCEGGAWALRETLKYYAPYLSAWGPLGFLAIFYVVDGMALESAYKSALAEYLASNGPPKSPDIGQSPSVGK